MLNLSQNTYCLLLDNMTHPLDPHLVTDHFIFYLYYVIDASN